MSPARARADGAGEERRAQILAAAETVFASKGVKPATIREISARAGVLPGSIYYYFDAKTDIVDAILGTFCQAVLVAYDEIVAAEPNGLDRIDAMARYAFSLIGSSSAALVIIQNDSPDLVADGRFRYLMEFNATVERHWLDAIELGKAQGAVRETVDGPLAYRFARDMILGANGWYEPGGRTSLDALAEAFATVIRRGLLVDRRPPATI